jgi:quinolinate synthase
MEQLHLDCEKKIQMLTNELQDLSEKVEELEKKHNGIVFTHYYTPCSVK